MKHIYAKPFRRFTKLTSLALLMPTLVVFGFGSAGLSFASLASAHTDDQHQTTDDEWGNSENSGDDNESGTSESEQEDSDHTGGGGTNGPGNHASSTCAVLQVMSGSVTKSAGWTATNTIASPLSPGQYSGAAFGSAVITNTYIPPWVDPMLDPHFATTSAKWVSSSLTSPGAVGNTEGTATSSQWRLFEDSFTLPAGAVVSSAYVDYTGDNAVAMYLNGTQVSTTNTSSSTDNVFGPDVATPLSTFSMVTSKNITPTSGMNTIDFVVRNTGGQYTVNPTGLLYHGSIAYCVPHQNSGSDVEVTILKYIDGQMATASSSHGASFPMSATWNATSSGAGTGSYALSAAGFNGNPTPYQAMTSPMTQGGSYSTNEVVGGAVVGASCTSGQPFALMGYAVGNSLQMAQAASTSVVMPAFTNLQHNKFVIVKNITCVGNPTNGTTTGGIGGTVGDVPLVVTSIDRVQTNATADDSFAHGWKYVFHITAPNSEPKLAMKFADWMNTMSSSTLAAGNNMRISSLQANNGGATILITGANIYSAPDLMMVQDLSSTTPGRQVEITVEVKIPTTTMNGTYTTNYGVRSLN